MNNTEKLLDMFRDWLNDTGALYSFVRKNVGDSQFRAFSNTPIGKLIGSIAIGQETLHAIAREAINNARSNDNGQ